MALLKKLNQKLRELWSNLLEQEDRSNLSPAPIPIRLERLQSNPLGRPSGYLSSQPEHLYWISFRRNDDEGTFLGVVIAIGKSPGDAASKAIDRLELPSNRALITMIPPEREKEFTLLTDKLLDEETASRLLKTLDISAIRS